MNWYSVNIAHSNKPLAWNVKLITKSIYDFGDILTKYEVEVTRLPNSLPREIQDIHIYMAGLKEATELHTNRDI